MTRGRILVVDDDPDVVRLLSLRLSYDGYQVSSAADGVACMAQVRREDPDLVVLDLGIPRAPPRQPALGPAAGCRSHGDQRRRRARAMRAGADAFFEKTAGIQEFLQTISRLLQEDHPSRL